MPRFSEDAAKRIVKATAIVERKLKAPDYNPTSDIERGGEGLYQWARITEFDSDARLYSWVKQIPDADGLLIDSSPAVSGEFNLAEVNDNAVAEDTIVYCQYVGGSDAKWIFSHPVKPIYRLEWCEDSSVVLYATNDLADDVDYVVKIEGRCYEVYLADDDECSGATCYEIESHHDDCEECNACWYLSPCDTGSAFTTSTDLSEHDGKVILYEDICYEVSQADSCEDAEPLSGDYFPYPTCLDCGKCYTLRSCSGEDELEIANDLATLREKTPSELVSDGDVFLIQGRCWYVYSFDTCESEPTTYTIDGSDYTDCSACGCFKLTECGSETPEIIYVHSATDEHAETVNLADYIGQAVRLDSGLVYSVEASAECDYAIATVVLEAYPSCDEAKCYTLQICDGTGTLTTYADLSAYAIGSAVKRDDNSCWLISDADAIFDDTEEFIVIGNSPSCPICNREVNYLLTQNCHDERCGGSPNAGENLITDTDLHDKLGQYIKYQGYCYQVSETEDPSTISDIEFTGGYTSCDSCLDAPIKTSVRVITGVATDSPDWVFSTMELHFTDGLLTGLCNGDEIRIDGTECNLS